MSARRHPERIGGLTLVGEGEYQVFYISPDGVLYGLGTNLRNLGTGMHGVPGLAIPVAVDSPGLRFKAVAGSLHGGLAVDENGNVWCWGDGAGGRMGDGLSHKQAVTKPVRIGADSLGRPFTGVKSVLSYFAGNGAAGSYALKEDGTLWIWGDTRCGMEGNGWAGGEVASPVQVMVPGGRKVVQAVAGNMLIVLCGDGSVWTCGGGALNGRAGSPVNLGYPTKDTTDYCSLHRVPGLEHIVQIAGGMYFNYALAKSGTLYGWGYYGDYLGIGQPGQPRKPVPVPVSLNAELRLPSAIRQIVTNSNVTHVILEDGSLWGWGDNAQGCVGNGQEMDYEHLAKPYAWDFRPANLLQLKPVRITDRNDFKAVFGSSVFTFYTYAETADGQLYSWGRNKGGVLGNGIIGPTPDIVALYPNSWDVPAATPVNPLALTSVTKVTSPYCKLNPDQKPCNQYRVNLPNSQ